MSLEIWNVVTGLESEGTLIEGYVLGDGIFGRRGGLQAKNIFFGFGVCVSRRRFWRRWIVVYSFDWVVDRLVRQNSVPNRISVL